MVPADGQPAVRRGRVWAGVAWYGHALSALGASSAAAPPPPAPAADGAEGSGDADDGDAAAVVTLLSNRAAAALKLGRWADAAADARARRRATLARSKRACAARRRFSRWERCRKLAFATAAVAAAAPADDDGGARRLSELRALPAKELRQRERELRRELDRLRDEGTPGERHVPRGRGRRPAAPATASADGGGGGSGALEKDELAAVVAEAERAVVAEGAEASLAKRAVREAEAMISRVGEVGEMARRGEWDGALEHASWLAREYPQHAVLRRLRLEALMSLGRYADARTLCDALLTDAPAAAELLHADAALRYRCEGAAAALAALAEVPAGEEGYEDIDELRAVIEAAQARHAAAAAALDGGRLDDACDEGCAALALADGSDGRGCRRSI